MKISREPDRYAYVYALIGSDGVIRYIGWSFNPYRRLKIHLSCTFWPPHPNDTDVELWLKELIRSGGFPEVLILSCHPDKWEAGKAERQQIDTRYRRGEPLTNLLIKGSPNHCHWVRNEVVASRVESEESIKFREAFDRDLAKFRREQKAKERKRLARRGHKLPRPK